jgi:multidrug efflux pump subunit AcrB
MTPAKAKTVRHGKGGDGGGDSLRYRRIVAKFGTNLLTAGSERLDLSVMSALVGQVARLHAQGADVIVVTSGAIAAGRHRLGMTDQKATAARLRRDIPLRQVLASVGQSHLMESYDQLFAWHDIVVAQTLLTYQSGYRPEDLWHFVTPDYRAASIWVQLKSGDNQDMKRVIEHVDGYVAGNPPPAHISVEWAGLTYLNVVWQDVMVSGMLKALLGSFVIVFLMMLALFRSFWFGLLAMLPLSITIALIYGLIGLAGKDYDMPVAVLSSLTLGLSVDFAIHFLQRARSIHAQVGSWRLTVERMFHEPARAIARNALVIAIGFLPLLASPLVPYNTVGLFLSAIMALSSAVTLLLLPSVMGLVRGKLFKETATLLAADQPGEA